MFGLVLGVASTVLLAYVLWRTASVALVAGRLSRRGFLAAGAAAWAVLFLAPVAGHQGSGPLAAVLEAVGMTLLGVVFLVAAALLAVDLLTVFGLVLRRWAPALRAGAILVGAGLSVVAIVQGNRPPAVVSYEVAMPGLPAALDGTVLVAASDAHLGTGVGDRWLSDRVGQIRALRPDIVVFVGDMFEGHGDAPPDLPALRELAPPLGKWFVNGNHESYGPAGGAERALEQAGCRRLVNQWREPAPGLVLAGVDDLSSHRRRGQGGDPLGVTLAGRPPGATVLLSHTPWEAERAARAGVGLMISGHTHGGQIWPFGYLVRTVHPLLAGRYEVGGMPVIVGRGTGTWGPRMRLWQRGEILKVTLRARPATAASHAAAAVACLA